MRPFLPASSSSVMARDFRPEGVVQAFSSQETPPMPHTSLPVVVSCRVLPMIPGTTTTASWVT